MRKGGSLRATPGDRGCNPSGQARHFRGLRGRVYRRPASAVRGCSTTRAGPPFRGRRPGACSARPGIGQRPAAGRHSALRSGWAAPACQHPGGVARVCHVQRPRPATDSTPSVAPTTPHQPRNPAPTHTTGQPDPDIPGVTGQPRRHRTPGHHRTTARRRPTGRPRTAAHPRTTARRPDDGSSSDDGSSPDLPARSRTTARPRTTGPRRPRRHGDTPDRTPDDTGQPDRTARPSAGAIQGFASESGPGDDTKPLDHRAVRAAARCAAGWCGAMGREWPPAGALWSSCHQRLTTHPGDPHRVGDMGVSAGSGCRHIADTEWITTARAPWSMRRGARGVGDASADRSPDGRDDTAAYL